MEGNGKIYGAILGVMADVGFVGKDQYNKTQNYKFRGIDDVMNALHPAMVKNGVLLVPEVLEQTREERTSPKGALLIYSICRVRFRFYASDGSFVEAVTVGEGMDSGDKASNKAMAAAMKYACFQTFCIPTEEMKDPDTESPEAVPKWKGNGKSAAGAKEHAAPETVTLAMVKSLYNQLRRTGVGLKGLLTSYGVKAAEELTITDYKDAMDKLEKRPDKDTPPPAPDSAIPENIPGGETYGLPFN